MARKLIRGAAAAALCAACLQLSGCSSSVGVGMNVGIPIGNHGYMSVGTNRWF